MSCPPFDTLHADENQDHLQTCEACRSLVALHSLERPDGNECERVEGFLGLLDELSPTDSKLLHGHLGDCPACMVTYLALIDDANASKVESPLWKGPGMDSISEPHMIRTRTALFAGLAFAAAAVLIVMVIQRRDAAETVATEATAVGTQARPGASRPAAVPPTKTPTRPSTNAPQSPSGSSAKLALLVVQSKSALAEERSEAGRGYCEEATAIDALAEDTAYVCALAECADSKERATFDRLVGQIPSPERRTEATEFCAKFGGATESDDEACDEVICLVDPGRPCCFFRPEVASDEERIARATRSIDRFVEGEDSGVDVDALVEKAGVALANRRYARGLASCEKALALDPKHQQAHLMCAIAACNLHSATKAKHHIVNIAGEARQASARQICIREGVDLKTDTAESLVEEARKEVERRKYAKGLATCERALDLEPGIQDAHMICGIAACNLGIADKANEHIKAIKGKSRSAALKQICIRQGVKL